MQNVYNVGSGFFDLANIVVNEVMSWLYLNLELQKRGQDVVGLLICSLPPQQLCIALTVETLCSCTMSAQSAGSIGGVRSLPLNRNKEIFNGRTL